jgi:hypothetical protein
VGLVGGNRWATRVGTVVRFRVGVCRMARGTSQGEGRLRVKERKRKKTR